MEPTTLMVTAAVAAASVVLIAWLCRAELAALVKADPFVRLVEGPEKITLPSIHPHAADLFFEFGQLGFLPAGVYWEWLGLLGPGYEVVFRCREEDCFGRVDWPGPIAGNRPHASFLTAFTSGAVVLTANHSGGLVANNPYFRAGPPAQAPAAEAENQDEPEDGRPGHVRRLAPLIACAMLLAGVGTVAATSDFSSVLPFLIPAVLGVVKLVAWWLAKPALEKHQRDESERVNLRWPLAVVVAEHRQRVEQFRAMGHTPLTCTSIADFAEGQATLERRPFCRFVLVALVCLVIAFKVIVPAAGSFVLWYVGVTEPLVLTGTFAAGCLLMSLLMPRSWWPPARNIHNLGVRDLPRSAGSYEPDLRSTWV